MSNKKPEISRSLEEMYKAVMKLGGPKGIFTQAIVDEYESFYEDLQYIWLELV